MSDVFKGEADRRQTDESVLSPAAALFRSRYRKLTAEELELHDAIMSKAAELADLFDRIERGSPTPGLAVGFLPNIAMNRAAKVTIAVRHLEDAVYRAVKALTS